MAVSIRDIASILPGTQIEPSTAVRGGLVSNAPAGSSDSGSGAPVGDQTALSALADRIRNAIGQASSISSFRPELVAQLKSAIASNSYNPAPDGVAASVAAAIGQQ
jgi:hypothetical protein